MFKKITIARKVMLLAVCFFALQSCNDEDPTPVNDNPTQIPDSGSYMRATVAGQPFTTRISGVEMAEASNGAGSIFITGTNANGDEIIIALEGITERGTYTVNFDSLSQLFYTNSDASYSTNICHDAVGTIVVTGLNDEKIEGTFEFTGRKSDDCDATKTITSGSFRGVFE